MFVAAFLALTAGAANAANRAVRIAGVSHLGDLATFVAEQRGLFAEAGLDASVTRLSDGRRALQRLRSGAADFALMALTPLVLDRLDDPSPHGAEDPVILASVVQSARLNQIVTLADTGIRDPADLAGRRLGLTRGTNAEFHWWLFARFHGIDPAGVEVIDLEKDELDRALGAGRIDAAVLWQPWTTRLRARVGERLRTFEHAGLYDAHWVLVTRRATAGDRPNLCRDVLRAYARATEAIEGTPQAALDRFHRALGLGDSVQPSPGYPFGFQVQLDWSVLIALGRQFEWAAATGRGGTGIDTPLLAMFAPGPLRRAAPEAVNVVGNLVDAERMR